MRIKNILKSKSKNFILTSILSQGFSFLLSLMIWKNFSVNDFYLLVQIEIITLIVSSFFGISTDQFLVRNYHEYDGIKNKEIIFNTWLINWTSVIIILVLFIFFLLFFSLENEVIIIYSVLSAGLIYLGQIPFNLIRFESNFKDYLIYNIFSFLLKNLFIYYFVLHDLNGIFSYYKAMFIFSLIIVPWYIWYLYKRSLMIFNWKIQMKILKFSYPIIPSTLFSNFIPIATRILLQNFGTNLLVAQFGVINKITSPLTALQNALRVLYVPQIVKTDKKKTIVANLDDVTLKYFYILLLFTLIFSLFSDNLVDLFFSKSFNKINNLNFFIFSTFLSNIYTYLSVGIFLARKNHYFLIPILSQIFIMFFPGIYLITHFGLEGLLLTELLKFIFYLTSGVVLSRVFYNYPNNIFLFIIPILLSCIFLFLFNFLSNFINPNLLFICKIIFFSFLIYFSRRRLHSIFGF